jgi:SAM-dependent methyltransferase
MLTRVPSIELHNTPCAICSKYGNCREVYPANFRDTDFNREVFSARRLPDRIHYRLVKCLDCGLVRSDPVADTATIMELYEQSTFDYGDEAKNLGRTYGIYLDRVKSFGSKRDSLLEIGCGNGFFLSEALDRGYVNVTGVEPSKHAKEKANPRVRDCIVSDIMRPGLFPADSFDTICCFQVLDHIPDPAALLQECCTVLKPGGCLLCLNHNVESISSKILKERSPIVDIEHTYLYSPETAAALFRNCGFSICEVGSAVNVYSLRYLIHLLPISVELKRFASNIADVSKMAKIQLDLPLGNLFLIAQKPDISKPS